METGSTATRCLRIAYLLESTALSGGVKVVALQAEALARRGHRVAVVSPEAAPRWFALGRAHVELSAFRDSRELAQAQVRVATFWTTVAPALEGARGPVFHLCQGYEGDFSFYAGSRGAIEEAYARPTHKLAVSEALAQRLRGRGIEPVLNVGQAFDGRGFFPGPGRNGAEPYVLIVGPYAADVKGIAVAFEGLARWRARGGAFRLRRIATHPPAAAERSSGLVDEYHHALAPDRMPFAYRASDIFIGPARPEEGFGLPVLEALASGLPCLLSDTPGHREIAGEAAWYFADGDPDALAASLPMVATREAREKARVEGPRAAARYDSAPVAEKLEKAFLEALGPAGGEGEG
ncbi:MAG: glycosyltransferase family 4 protein [Thermoanaerobaculia bacterium]